MPYMRIALMSPRPEHAEQVHDLQVELLQYDKTLHGFLGGYVLETEDGTDRIGRVAIWETRSDADHAAQEQHTLTRRSDLLRLIRRGPSSRLEIGAEATRV